MVAAVLAACHRLRIVTGQARLLLAEVKPLQQMSAAAKRFAVGDFSYRVKVHGNDELSDLANAFNDMANALDKLENSRRSPCWRLFR